MSTANILSTIDVADAYIKSTSGFSTYFSGYGWYGSVNSVNIGDGYMLNLPGSEDKVLSYSGSEVSPVDYPISVSTGWNWIKCCSIKLRYIFCFNNFKSNIS